MKPLLKWAGGKRHIAATIQQHMPEDWVSGTYFEPFLGGAALFLHLGPKRAVLGDINGRLVNFYKDVQSRPGEVILEIQAIEKAFNALATIDEKNALFLEVRNEFNSSSSDNPRSSALMYCLNKLCFNGLYRENSKGGFNVPFGKKTVFPSPDIENFELFSKALANAQIMNEDFQSVISSAEAGDFVYFDPPYIPLDRTSNFTSYAASGFNLDDQQRLASVLAELKSRGIRAMVSNSDTETTREIYRDSRFVEITAPRSVSAKASGRGRIDELLIVNY
jgi:DNA adenine methylase